MACAVAGPRDASGFGARVLKSRWSSERGHNFQEGQIAATLPIATAVVPMKLRRVNALIIVAPEGCEFVFGI